MYFNKAHDIHQNIWQITGSFWLCFNVHVERSMNTLLACLLIYVHETQMRQEQLSHFQQVPFAIGLSTSVLNKSGLAAHSLAR